VKFHDGSEMTAEDVAFSLAWQLWPEVYSWGKSYMSNLVGFDEVTSGKSKELAGVKVVDPYTVQVTLKKPQAVFPALLTMSMNAISPKKVVLEAGKDWGTKVIVGTGPFKFKEWQRGQRAVYERNPNYFKPGLPYLDRIELYVNVDPSVQMLRFESGQAEFIHDIPPAELPRVLTDPKYQKLLLRTGTTNCVRLGFHVETKPFNDIRVRQAIAMAIDKQAIVKKFSGTVTPLEGFFVPSMLQFDKNFKSKYQYNPQQAKQLLAEAGHASGIKGVKMYTGIGDTKTLGEMVQADLRSIGVEVELAVGQWKEWRDKIRAGEVPLFIYGWAASFLDAADYISAWTTCAAIKDGYNDGKYCNQKIDELYDAAERLPLNDPKRIEAYRQIEDIVINQDVAWAGLANPQQLALGKEYVHNVTLEFLVGWPRLEQVWMEKR
jgi:ABC-type transport system substrate-binding protein